MSQSTDRDENARVRILGRLAASREELRRLLDSPRKDLNGGSVPADETRGFPRSRTMQMLMSSRGLTTLGATAAGLLIARPALALRLVRMLPASAFARILLVRAMSAFRANKNNRGD
jgi:hypothetical protein